MRRADSWDNRDIGKWLGYCVGWGDVSGEVTRSIGSVLWLVDSWRGRGQVAVGWWSSWRGCRSFGSCCFFGSLFPAHGGASSDHILHPWDGFSRCAVRVAYGEVPEVWQRHG